MAYLISKTQALGKMCITRYTSQCADACFMHHISDSREWTRCSGATTHVVTKSGENLELYGSQVDVETVLEYPAHKEGLYDDEITKIIADTMASN